MPRPCSPDAAQGPHCHCPCLRDEFLLLFAFSQHVLCCANAILQREVSHGREGSSSSFVEGLKARLSQEMEGRQNIRQDSLQRSGRVFINSCPAVDLREAFNLTVVSEH